MFKNKKKEEAVSELVRWQRWFTKNHLSTGYDLSASGFYKWAQVNKPELLIPKLPTDQLILLNKIFKH